ncbi:hypothetical protein ACF0H5_023460 [Mactra antiquata]
MLLRSLPSSFPETSPEENADVEDIVTFTENIDEDIDGEFELVINAIMLEEAESVDFEIPEGFNMDTVMENMNHKTVVTSCQAAINEILGRIIPHRLITFVKKTFLKLGSCIDKLSGKKDASGIPERHLAHFYHSVHEYCGSTEYRINCLMLFKDEDFTENHKIVCYNILEAVRVYYVKQKVRLLKVSEGGIRQRHVTNASKARIRYVAGYCVAALRKKYIKIQRSNMFSKVSHGQEMYTDAKWILYILNLLKEDESFLKAHTDEPDSLIDIERRQYASRGLINVTDNLYKFFIELTEKCMFLLAHENLMQYGKNMYNTCLEQIENDQCLYEKFVNVIVSSHSSQTIEEFDESNDVDGTLDKIVNMSTHSCKIFLELIRKYLMVLLSQLRKDIKDAYKVGKTIAHRKQIKLPCRKTTMCITEASTSSETVGTDSAEKITDHGKASSTVVFGVGQQTQLLPAASQNPERLPIQQSMHRSSEQLSQTKIICQSCYKCKDDEVIQCHSCTDWFHRKCCGLRSARLWDKFKTDDVKWLCKSCK